MPKRKTLLIALASLGVVALVVVVWLAAGGPSEPEPVRATGRSTQPDSGRAARVQARLRQAARESEAEAAAKHAERNHFAPADGTPEQLLQRLFVAALSPDEDAARREIAALDHAQLAGESAEGRELRFLALRRRVKGLAVVEGDKVGYRLQRHDVTPEGTHRLFVVVNDGEGMPEPFAFARDPSANDAWRLTRY
jgi:hypothetical protein